MGRVSDIQYPVKTEEEWAELLDEGEIPDCSDYPLCPLNFDEEGGCACVLMLINNFEYTSFPEICGRVGLLRKQLRALSPTSTKEEEDG